MKTCPYCAEQIQDAAKLCPHCKQAVFSTDPGKNAAWRLIIFILVFYIGYKAISAFVHSESEKEMDRIMRSVDKYK